MKIVHTLPQDRWRDFVDRHPDGNIFHTPEMAQVFAQTRGHQTTLWAVTGDDGQVLALLPLVHVTLKGGPLRRLTTRAIAYGSLLYAPGAAGQRGLAALLQAYTREAGRDALFTELRNLSDLEAVQPILNEHGFVYEDHLNYLIDLQRPPQEIMQSMSRRTRKKIRRGLRKAEVVIQEASRPEQVQTCYALLSTTYAQAQVPLTHRSLFDATFQILYPKGMVKFLLAQVGDAYAAASVELLYKDVIYGWYGGTDREYSAYIPTEMLTWHILRWGAENGYRLYDFGGAGKPDEEYGVRDFKAKFGGDLVCFGRNTYVPSPTWLKLSKIGYAVYQRWLGGKS